MRRFDKMSKLDVCFYVFPSLLDRGRGEAQGRWIIRFIDRARAVARGRWQLDTQIVSGRLAHVMKQALDHMARSVGGRGPLQVLDLFLLRQDMRRDHLADGSRKGRHEQISLIEAFPFVADDRYAFAQPLDQGRASNRTEQILGPHLVLVFEQLAIQCRHA
jgi:hypothetical protein